MSSEAALVQPFCGLLPEPIELGQGLVCEILIRS